MIQHLKIRIYGKVQGVFYRASTKEKADELGLKGFVRNEPDGSVYAEAEGTNEQLDKLINWCRQGPVGAKVVDVNCERGEIRQFEQFEIRR
jgi:acylphosphatase